MDIFFVIFVALLTFVIVVMLFRFLQMENASVVEPVTQRDCEAQSRSLLEEIQVLEDRVRHGAATRKMKLELENLRRQADDLLTLLAPSLITDMPQDFRPDIGFESPSTPVSTSAGRNKLQICSHCGSQLQQRFQG